MTSFRNICNTMAILPLLFFNCKDEPKQIPIYTEIVPEKHEAVLEYNTKAKLGEGAFWNYKTQELYWVDIEGKKLHIYNPSEKTNKTLEVPSRIGTVVPQDQTHAMVALEDGIYKINTKTGELSQLSDVESDKPFNRFNDGKCDPMGRLWVGSMNFDAKSKTAALYMVDSEGKTEKKLDSVMISNGIVWTSDKKTMYYADTPLGNIRAFDYDNDSGTITNERVAIVIPDSLGSPDGMTIDAHDNLWVALWGGSAVGHFNPKTGTLIEKIGVPAKNVTSCAFGGKNLDTLYITTASIGMTENETKQYPQAGALFKYYPDVKGVNSDFFGQISQ